MMNDGPPKSVKSISQHSELPASSRNIGWILLATIPLISSLYEPESKLVVLGMGDLPPLIRNPYNGYINPYYWVDDHPLLYGNNGSLDPSTYNSLMSD